MEATPKTESPAAKPRNKNLILIGIVVIVLIVVGVGIYEFNQIGNTSKGTPITIYDGKPTCLTASDCGFTPVTFNATSGTKLYWTNTGTQAHTATSCDSTHPSTTGCPTTNQASLPAFDTGSVGAGTGSNSITFSQVGTYHYYCSFHPWMHATVNVQ